MTRILNEQNALLISSLATVGDENFDRARAFAESRGFDLIADGAELRRYCEEQAIDENVDAQYALAEFLYVGLFGEQDKLGAYEWCRRAAEKGHAPSIYMLAGLVGDGTDIALETKSPLELMLQVANQGYVPALRSLGVMYLTGSGAKLDSNRGYEYLEAASKSGDSYSQFMLGTMILDMGEPARIAEGLHWIKKSADFGFQPALEQLAEFYKNGLYGLPKDQKLADSYSDRASIAEVSKQLRIDS